MKTKNSTIYIAEDGKEFTDEKSCLDYEKKVADELENTTFWEVVHQPDLTEGRGYYGLTYLKVKKSSYPKTKDFVEDFCYRTYGRKITFVQGCSPMVNWTLSESSREKFFKKNKSISVGDYSYPAKHLDLVRGDREDGLTVNIFTHD